MDTFLSSFTFNTFCFLNCNKCILFLSYFIYFRKGLIYLEVPIDENDFIVVPPLEGFVMNRVLGDYFETLLYKIFVSIDERTSVGEVIFYCI